MKENRDKKKPNKQNPKQNTVDFIQRKKENHAIFMIKK